MNSGCCLVSKSPAAPNCTKTSSQCAHAWIRCLQSFSMKLHPADLGPSTVTLHCTSPDEQNVSMKKLYSQTEIKHAVIIRRRILLMIKICKTVTAQEESMFICPLLPNFTQNNNKLTQNFDNCTKRNISKVNLNWSHTENIRGMATGFKLRMMILAISFMLNPSLLALLLINISWIIEHSWQMTNVRISEHCTGFTEYVLLWKLYLKKMTWVTSAVKRPRHWQLPFIVAAVYPQQGFLLKYSQYLFCFS